MVINRSNRFKRSFQKLPSQIQDDFVDRIRLFADQPFDVRLRTHKLKGKLHECYAFELREGFRVLFEFVSGGGVNLLDVGPHDRYLHWG